MGVGVWGSTDGTSRQTNATKSFCNKAAAALCPRSPGPHGPPRGQLAGWLREASGLEFVKLHMIRRHTELINSVH